MSLKSRNKQMNTYREPSSAMELDEQRATAHKLYVNALVALILIGIELGIFPILWIFVEPTPSQKIGIFTGFLACLLCFIAVAIYFAPLVRDRRAFKTLRSTASEPCTVTVKRVRLLRFSRGKYDPGTIVGYRLSCEDGAKYILLAHLSEENNNPDLAYNETLSAIADREVTLKVADQYCPVWLLGDVEK